MMTRMEHKQKAESKWAVMWGGFRIDMMLVVGCVKCISMWRVLFSAKMNIMVECCCRCYTAAASFMTLPWIIKRSISISFWIHLSSSYYSSLVIIISYSYSSSSLPHKTSRSSSPTTWLFKGIQNNPAFFFYTSLPSKSTACWLQKCLAECS